MELTLMIIFLTHYIQNSTFKHVINIKVMNEILYLLLLVVLSF